MKEEVYYIHQSEINKKLIDFEMCGITYPDKNYSITRKNSLLSCIEYIIKGSGVINTDGKSYRVYEGDTYFLHQGHDQYYYADSEEPFEKIFINMSGELAQKLSEGYGLTGCNLFKNLDTKDELTKIFNMSKDSEEDNTLIILSLINSIFHKMHSSLVNVGETGNVAYKMREYLDTKISDKFRLCELCNLVSLSEAQVIRIFKKAYGITPYAYLVNKKIEFSKKLLTGTNLTIKQIAYELSFADEYYFSNVFKSKTGSYPLVYRKRINI